MDGERPGTEAPEYNPNNENGVRILNKRLAELLADLIDKGHGEINVRVVATNHKLQYVEFNPTERIKLS